MQIDLSRAERARLHIAMLEALPADDTHHAYAETVAYAEFPGEVFELARAIDAYIAAALYRADVQYVDVDADDLRAALDAETVNWALRLCGVQACVSRQTVRWTDAPLDGRTRTLPVKLPATLLDDWNNP